MKVRASTLPLRPGLTVGLLATFKVLLHLATANRYGIFRDELYYVACARHLAFGYVDHPPLIALVTWIATHLSGLSLLGLRLLPALAGGMLVLVSAQIARELGGGRFAEIVAAVAVIPVPIYLILSHWLTMNAFEPLIWMGVIWAALRMVRESEPRLWLLIGALVGLGLENKYTMLLLAAAVVCGFVLTPQRRLLKNWWFLAGVGVAILLFLPNVLWLVHNGFPFLEFERHSRASGSRILRGPFAFVADQMLIMNPLMAPLWIAGLLWLLLAKAARAFRFAGWAALLLGLLMVVVQAKNYYLTPIYPILFAAGAVALEVWTARDRMWLRPAYLGLIAVSFFVLAPLVMPILPIRSFLAYQQRLHGFTPVRFEALPNDPLPQYFSDEFGWEEMARRTAAVYNSLPESERRTTAIFANNYGEAAAIDFFGPRFGLPPAIGKNETYWLWGPREYTGSTVLVLGSDGRGDREHFRSVESVAEIDDPLARSEERFTVFLCRGLSPDLQTLWPKLKAW